MEIKCTAEELLKIVSVKQTDTIEIKEPLITAETIEKLNQRSDKDVGLCK